MKISLMTSLRIISAYTKHRKYTLLGPLLVLFIGVGSLKAASPPKELTSIIHQFMDMERTSIHIEQVIQWKYYSKRDTIRVEMDIEGNRNFHVLLPGMGMEIFVTQTEMITLNHIRNQILYENATPDALVKQLFVGGDLNRARFKGEKKRPEGGKQLNFSFADEFSEWERLSTYLDETGQLTKLVLVDHDGNKYVILMNYQKSYRPFRIPQVELDYATYQVADLRTD